MFFGPGASYSQAVPVASPTIRPASPAAVIAGQTSAKRSDLHSKSEQPLSMLYSQGHPTAEEQYILELINRARANPDSEGIRLYNIDDQYVNYDYQSFGTPTRAQVRSDFATYSPKPPLAFNASLVQSATGHSQTMLLVDSMYHFGPDGSPQSRDQAAGYSSQYVGENVGAYDRDLEEDHDGFQIDFGNPGLGHRLNIMNFDPTGPFYTEIGLGIIHGGNGWPDVGPIITTEDFGNANQTFVLGVVYSDNNRNRFYDIGEGDSGVKITLSSGSYYAVTSGSGGYAIPYSGSGSVTVTASGGSFPTPVTKTIDFNGQNVKVDFNPDLTGYPTQVTLALPVVDTTVNVDTVAFTWDAVALATKYHIQISTDSLMPKTKFVLNDSSLVDTIRKFSGFKDSTTYFWRVQAKNAKGVGPWSATSAFTMGLAPSPIALISPATGANVGNSDVTFLWHAANKGGQSYAVVVASDKALKNVVWTDTLLSNPNDTTDVSPAANFQAGQTYYWGVSAYNDYGWGRPSATNSFVFSVSSVAPANAKVTAVTVSPNPTTGETHIRFMLGAAADVGLRIFNSVGDEVQSIALGRLAPSTHDYVWDGSALAAGSYTYELRTGDRTETGRIVLIK